jgi:CheY-like chemotaxis protein
VSGDKGSTVKTILLVDDEPAIIETFAEVLIWEGFHVVTAANGKEGLEKLETLTPDLALIDYMMPVMDGVDMIRAMWANPAYAEIPIIMISAAPMALPQDIRKRVPILGKPFDVAVLLRIILEKSR